MPIIEPNPVNHLLVMPPMQELYARVIPFPTLTYINWTPGQALPLLLRLRLYADMQASVKLCGALLLMTRVELRRHPVDKPDAFDVLWYKDLPGRAIFNTAYALSWTPWLITREGDIELDTSRWPVGDYNLQLVATTQMGATAYCYHNQPYSANTPTPVLKVAAVVEGGV